MGSKQCEVCKETRSKYKCPSCLIPYCSLACFKKHKENPCKPSAPPVEELQNPCKPSAPPVEQSSATVHLEKLLEVDEPSCVLSNEQLQSIVESDEIRGFLNDTDLQKLITKIDSSQDPENELDKAMKGHNFRQFTDKVLSIVNPQE